MPRPGLLRSAVNSARRNPTPDSVRSSAPADELPPRSPCQNTLPSFPATIEEIKDNALIIPTHKDIVFITVREQFSTEQHSTFAQRIADDVPVVGEAKHQGHRARPESFDDFAACRQHGRTAPRRELDVALDLPGVSGHMATDDGGSKGREFTALMLDKSNFDLALTNATCLHQRLQREEHRSRVKHFVWLTASDIFQAGDIQCGTTSYSTAAPRVTKCGATRLTVRMARAAWTQGQGNSPLPLNQISTKCIDEIRRLAFRDVPPPPPASLLPPPSRRKKTGEIPPLCGTGVVFGLPVSSMNHSGEACSGPQIP